MSRSAGLTFLTSPRISPALRGMINDSGRPLTRRGPPYGNSLS